MKVTSSPSGVLVRSVEVAEGRDGGGGTKCVVQDFIAGGLMGLDLRVSRYLSREIRFVVRYMPKVPFEN